MKQNSNVADCLDALSISLPTLETLVSSFIYELKGNNSLAMLQSCVRAVPTGKETGVFYGIDLGGTNLRVLRKELPSGSLTQLKERIPDKAKSGEASDLFGFIADNVAKLAKRYNDQSRIPIGFTFSFPMEKASINSATLLRWTKGFQTQGVVGKDIGKLLQHELDSRGVNAEVSAIVNDTVATQLAGGLGRAGCFVGVIIGTGTNAAYFSRKGEIINTEWGNFNRGLPRTAADIAIDESTVNAGAQQFEKMISGMYMGRIAQETLQTVLGMKLPEIESRSLGFAMKDPTTDLLALDAYLRSLGVELSLPQRQLWRRVCQLIVHRSADLAAVGISALIRDMGLEPGTKVIVAVDGAVFGKPTYKERIRWTMSRLGVSNVTLLPVEDGSGIGAILAAAVTSAPGRAKL